MKYNTIKGYLGGGYVRPMSYQSGGYIPGVSQAKYGIGLQRDINQAQKEFEEQARKVAEEQKKRGLFSTLGSMAGTALGAALAPATGGLSLVAAKGLGSALGAGVGEMAAGKMYDSGHVKKSSTGLFSEDFSDLSKLEKEMGRGALGRSLGTGAATALNAGIGELGKAGVGSLYGGAMNKLRFGTSDMTGKVVDSAGNLTSIPEIADTSIMDKYFESKGYQTGGNVDILEHTANLRKKMADSPMAGADTLTDVGNQFVGPLLPEDAKFRDHMRIISEMSEGIPELDIRRDYGADRRSSARIRQMDKASQMKAEPANLDIKRGSGMDFNLSNIQGVDSPSLIGEEYAMARDSSNTQRKMEDLSRNLGAYIATAEGNMGQAIPDQGIRRSVQEDNLYNTQAQMPYFRLPMYKHGGKVGAYKGGRGLLSMMPFSRRIV